MTRTSVATSALTALLFAACGGSGSSSSPAVTPPGGTATALAISGTIAAKGAGTMTVNGVPIRTGAATVLIEKQQRPETELHRGMVVRVKGGRDASGVAQAAEIQFEDQLKGRAADDVLAGATALTVGGRAVQIDDMTRVMDDKGVDLLPEALRRDDRLRVSGFADAQGRLHASSIERQATASADDSFEAKGYVIAIAADRTSLDLSLAPGGPLAWHVTMATGTLPAAIAVGALVEVHASAAAVGTAITASSVSLEDDALGDAGAEVELEGIVSAGNAASFQLAGHAVVTSATTRWENGLPADLLPGARVEAEGHLDAGGKLIAEKVSFCDSARLQGTVAGAAGSFSVLGFPLALTGTTEGAGLLVAGAVVELRGHPGASGSVIVVASVQAVSSGNPRSFIQGPVTAVNAGAGSLVILGVTVTAAAGASFSDHELVVLSRDAFFARVVAGRSVVKARVAAAPSGVPPAVASDELELEDEPSSHP